MIFADDSKLKIAEFAELQLGSMDSYPERVKKRGSIINNRDNVIESFHLKIKLILQDNIFINSFKNQKPKSKSLGKIWN